MLTIPMPHLTVLINVLCKLWVCQPEFAPPEVILDGESPLEDNYVDSNYAFKNEKVPFVQTEAGTVEGYFMTTSNSRQIYAFQGIPYGSAGRWQSPVPATPWKGIFKATSPGKDCLQFNVRKYLKIYGYEDCLNLNVYTPTIDPNAKLPTVLYIHGGSFLFGSGGDHGPSILLTKKIVLVTFNYRLGVFGFMSTADNIMPGNWGLKDQALAVQWVKDNVAYFGGNPKDITLWGYSAGAVSTHLHLMSNRTKHSFTKGISNSGNGFMHWGVHPPWRARHNTQRLASYFNCPKEDSEELRNCMMKIDPVSLVSAQVHLVDWFPFPPVVFVPTVEVNDTENNPDAFLTMMPEEYYRNKEVAKIPWISSTTAEEGLSAEIVSLLVSHWLPTKQMWYQKAKYVLDLDYIYSRNPANIIRKITKFYLKGKPPILGTFKEYGDMLTDRLFHFAVMKSLQAHSEVAPTYSYIFSFHNGSYNLGNLYKFSSQEWGAGHGEDEGYFFNSTFYSAGFKKSDPEYKVSKMMVNLIHNFIYTGVPSYTDELGNKLDIWKPVKDSRNLRMLNIDSELKMVTPDLQRVKFWQDLNIPDTTPWVKL